MSMEKFKYSYRLAELRRKTGKTQKEVAAKLEITPASLSAYEKGTKMPSMEVAISLTKYYGVSLDYIFRPLAAESNHPSTYADVLKCLFKSVRGGIPVTISAQIAEYDFLTCEHATIDFADERLFKVFSAWSGLRRAYDDGSLDDEVLELWEKKKLEEFGEIFTPSAQALIDEIFDAPAEVEETGKGPRIVDDEDLPF